MAQFPVSDDQGIIDGLNYVLSGPVSLGQNFTGFTSSDIYDFTGAYRPPFALINTSTDHIPMVKMYVAPIALSTSEMLDGRTLKFTFATPQADPPFVVGQGCEVEGVADSFYNDQFFNPGIIECTTDYLIVRLLSEYPLRPSSAGGTLRFNIVEWGQNSTDCNGKVTVTSPTDRVFITAQLNNKIVVNSEVDGSCYYIVKLNRLTGFPNNNPINPDYLFDDSVTLASKTVILTNPTGTMLEINPDWNPVVPVDGVYPVVSVPVKTGEFDVETLFASVLDQPGPGYYWYLVEIEFVANGTPLEIDACQLSLRSFTSQVVKA